MNPKRKREKQSHAMLMTNPRRIVAAANAILPTKAMGALPCFAQSFPDGRNAKKTPIDEERRIAPSVALEM